MLNLEQTSLEIPDLTIEPLNIGNNADSKFDLTLYASETTQGIKLTLVYNIELFAAGRMVEMLRQFEYLLQQIVEDSLDKPIADFSLVTPQGQSLLPDPSVTLSEPEYESVTSMFATWSKQTPEQVAICHETDAWNYVDLWQIAHTLAQILLAERIERGDVIAVSGASSFGLIASILAQTSKSTAASNVRARQS